MAKTKRNDFPYAELEFTKPADTLKEAVYQWIFRTTGEKPTHKEILDICNLILENRR